MNRTTQRDGVALVALRGMFAAAVFLLAAIRVPCTAAEQPPKPTEVVEGDLQQRIARLIEQLGDDDYHRREAAQNELAEIGADAFDALLEASHHEDLEIAARAQYLLRLIPAQWNLANQSEEVRDLLDLYSAQPATVRFQVLRLLGRLSEEGGWAAMCRLVRFEQDPLWSKRAAVQLIAVEPMDRAGRKRWAHIVEKNTGRSLRPAAKWLRTHLQTYRNRQKAIAQWRQLIEAEQATAQHQPQETSPEIVAALWYFLAMACAEDGQMATAAEAVQKALAANPCRTDIQASAQIEMAVVLQRHGYFDWAEAGYRRVIQLGQVALAVRAAHTLGEMFFDIGKPAEAADVLSDLLKMLKENHVAFADASGTTPSLLRARMNYFLACHWKQQGDMKKHRRYLEQAIAANPNELDSLIARFHLPNVSPEYRRASEKLIEAAVARLRDDIAQSADDPSAYNQLAWLVGNTTGDMDEALQCARRAVELGPNEAAFLDTLAHVCFARGELEDAVKYESRAAELEPHSLFIGGELKRFRAALEEKTAGKQK